jgi:hypothetical protein
MTAAENQDDSVGEVIRYTLDELYDKKRIHAQGDSTG